MPIYEHVNRIENQKLQQFCVQPASWQIEVINLYLSYRHHYKGFFSRDNFRYARDTF